MCSRVNDHRHNARKSKIAAGEKANASNTQDSLRSRSHERARHERGPWTRQAGDPHFRCADVVGPHPRSAAARTCAARVLRIPMLLAPNRRRRGRLINKGGSDQPRPPGTVPTMTTNTAAGQHVLTLLAAAVEASTDPLNALSAVAELKRAVAVAEGERVELARAAGASWAAIGQRLGVTKQATSRRFAPRAPGGVIPAQVSTEVAPAKGKSGWVVTTPRGRTLLVLRRRA